MLDPMFNLISCNGLKQVRLIFYRIIICISLSFLLTGCESNDFHLIPFNKYIIPQNGMFPNMPANSSFWALLKPVVVCADIKRGDVIVYKEKENDKDYIYVWRVIGLPGDKVSIKNTSVIINGKELSHEKTDEDAKYVFMQEHNADSTYLVAYEKALEKRVGIDVTVPTESFFVMGDNRDDARDSRFAGAVGFKKVIGKKM